MKRPVSPLLSVPDSSPSLSIKLKPLLGVVALPTCTQRQIVKSL